MKKMVSSPPALSAGNRLFPRGRRLSSLALAALCAFATSPVTLLAKVLPPHNVSAANVNIIQNDTGNTAASVTATTTLSINDFQVRPGSNRGDYNVQIGAEGPDDLADGLLMVSITENGRDNLEGTGTNYTAPSFDGNAGGYWLVVQDCTTSRAEYNANVAAGFFRYTNWLCGWARNTTGANGGTNDFFTASPGLVLGTHFKGLAGGRSLVDLRSLGVNSTNDGVLIVNHAKNEGNYGLSHANEDGTWSLFVKDNFGNAASYEQDPVAFVYVPRTNNTVISGKFLGNGDILIHNGAVPQFTITNTDIGTWRLTIPGYYPTNGVLILSAEGGLPINQDNVVSYQADGDGWIIESRDITAIDLPQLETPDGEPVASFVFIPGATPGFTVSPTNNLITTEAGGTATFTVTLDVAPLEDVTIDLTSSTPAEGTVSPTTLTFTAGDWNVPQIVTITGQDDANQDGAKNYQIILAPAVSNDPSYTGLKPVDVSVINADDDQAGITVSPTTGLVTTEAGDSTSFTVVLNSLPPANVTIGLSSDNTAEAIVSPASVTFTPDDWNLPQIVTVFGVDDFRDDGNVSYKIITAPAVSASGIYNNLNAPDVTVTNVDNDTAGFLLVADLPITVSEISSTNYTLALGTQPQANVTVQVVSSDVNAATVSPATLTFTPSDWSTPKAVTVQGVNDFVSDGTTSFRITNIVSSTDPIYGTLTLPTLPALVNDDEPKLTLPSDNVLYALATPAITIEGLAAVTEPDTAVYTGGSVTAALTLNGNASDRLEIRSGGTNETDITVTNSAVYYGTNVIGEWTGGTGLTPLVVTLNTNATPLAVQALIRAFTFQTATDVSSLATRTVTVTLNDGAQGIASAAKQVRVGSLRLSQYQEEADYGYGIYSGEADIALSEAAPATAWPAGRSPAPGEGLLIDWQDAGVPNASQVLLRFDDFVGTNIWQIPTNAVIVSAELIVKINNTGDGGTLHRMLKPWDATNDTWLSWNGGVKIDDQDARATYESQMGVQDGTGATGNGFISVGVTPDVQAWVNGQTNYGWVLNGWPFNTDGTGFSPSEVPTVNDRPRLRVLWLPAGERTASFRQGVNEYTNAFDTRVRQAEPDAPANALAAVFVDGSVIGTNDQDHVLIRFDQLFGSATNQIPPGARVDAAMLDLSSVVGNAMGDGGRFYAMLQPWDDTVVTWNSLVDGVQPDGVEAALTPTTLAGNANLDPNVQGAFNSFDVTPDVQAWAAGQRPNYGWAILPWTGGGDGWGFGTSEAEIERNRPQLRVFYTVSANNVTAAPTILPLGLSSGQVQVQFNGTPARTYSVQRAAALTGPWSPVGPATTDGAGHGTVTDNAPLPGAGFYRVVYP